MQQISTRWLRHTTLTWVERHFGYAVSRAFAGHTDSRVTVVPRSASGVSVRPPRHLLSTLL
ncbi:hypothetical protein [Saccharopolyspora erythraea]|uniref:hypothetical protein n=1 Tax=Saccharopolyspora erythraea TaxID=1836 RepID=UPI003D8034FC